MNPAEFKTGKVNPVFSQLSMTRHQISLFNRIKRKGLREQEKSMLFPGLYGSKPLTRRTIGEYKNFNRNLNNKKFQP